MRHGLRLASVSLAVTLALSACTGSGGAGSSDGGGATGTSEASGQAWSEIEVHSSVLPQEPVLHVSAAGPAQGNGEPLFVGSSVQPGEGASAAVWTTPHNGMGEPVLLDVGTDTSRAVAVAVHSDDTYVAGSTWDAGRRGSFVQHSTDLESWSAVDLPAAVQKRRFVADALTTLPDGEPFMVGVTRDHGVAGVMVDEGEVVDLPAPDDAVPEEVVGLATSSTEIVVLVRARTGDAPEAPEQVLSYISTDQGASWVETGALPGREITVAGLARAGQEFVATGSAARRGVDTATAWYSPDGIEWSRHRVNGSAQTDGWDTSLGAPVVARGTLGAPYLDSASADVTVLQRSERGKWQDVGTASAQITPGPEALLGAAERGVEVVLSGLGRVQSGRITGADDEWEDIREEVPTEATMDSWAAVGLDGGDPTLVGEKPEADVDDADDWSTSTSMTPLSMTEGLTGTTLAPANGWDPTAGGDVAHLDYTTDDSGRTVALGDSPQDDEDDASDVVGWSRSSSSGDHWQKATGLDGDASEYLGELRRVDDGWVAVGTEESDTGTVGAVWTSESGVSWERAEGPFATNRDSRLEDVCPLPDGDVYVVGALDHPRRGSVPLAFQRTEDGWRRADLSGLPKKVTALTGCAVSGDRVLLQGDSPGPKTWVTTDLRDFTGVSIGNSEDRIGTVQGVSDGFAVSGRMAHKSHQGPAVWLSADGEDWRALPVPTDVPAEPFDVLEWNDRLLVPLTYESSPEVLALEDLPGELAD